MERLSLGGPATGPSYDPPTYEASSGLQWFFNSHFASVYATLPAGVTEGDLLIGQVVAGPAGTVAALGDWTLADTRTSNIQHKIFYKIAGASEGNPLVDTDTNAAFVRISRFSNVNQTTPLDGVTATGATANATSITVPSITVATANSMVVSLVSVEDDQAQSWGGTSGSFTSRYNSGSDQNWDGSLLMGTEVMSTVGTRASISNSSTNSWNRLATSIVIRAADA